MYPHEVPTRLNVLPSLGPVPLRALPWLALGVVAFGLGVWLSGGPVALLVTDRWAALGLRLALGLAAALPFLVLTAPGVVYGHSIPGYVGTALRGLVVPRLALYRPVPPCEPAVPDPHGRRTVADTWGGEREEW